VTKRILLVDDDPNILRGFKRHFRNTYDAEFALGGEAAVALFRSVGPFAVVVSDMQMPDMSGVELLRTLRSLDSQTVRIMLTGNADQRTAAEAVNEGHIFRFLNKPCSPDELAKSIDAGLEQYRLLTAEAELLNKTLAGSVRILTQVLSMAMPEAFGLTPETRRLAREVAEKVGAKPIWQIDMAAMLMRVGCVSLPRDVLRRYLHNEPLDRESQQLIDATPRFGYNLISVIPRLEAVAETILHQHDPLTDEPSLAARILKVVGDFQRFRQSTTTHSALQRLERSDAYDRQVIDGLWRVIQASAEYRAVLVSELRAGMVLESHIEDSQGRILVAAGHEVHAALIQKLQLIRRSAAGIREPIEVQIPASLKGPSNLRTTPQPIVTSLPQVAALE